MKRLCYLYTDFQRLVFNAAARTAEFDPACFQYLTYGYCRDGRLPGYHRIQGGYKRAQLRRARALVREVRDSVDRLIGRDDFELWLASDNSAVGQILVNHPRCKRLVLFEDGLANYGIYYPLFSRKNLLIELFRLRNALFLAPHARLPKRAGETGRAAERYGLTEYSFPGLPNRKLINRNYFLDEVASEMVASGQDQASPLDDRDLLLVDIFKDDYRANRFRPMVVDLVREMVEREDVRQILIKPHPGAPKDFVGPTAELLGREIEQPIRRFERDTSLEAIFMASRDRSPLIGGLISSSLYTARLIAPSARVYCYGQGTARIYARRDTQVQSMSGLGVTVV